MEFRRRKSLSLINFSLERAYEQYTGKPTIKDKFTRYRPLYGAILEGDWEKVKRFIDDDDSHGEAAGGSITQNSETALMVAVKSRQRIEFIQKLVDLLPSIEEDLYRQNSGGNTALHEAAIVGHVEAAKLLVEKKASLLYIPNFDGHLPLHAAAANGQREITYFFLKLELETETETEADLASARKLAALAIVVHLAIKGRLFDVASILVLEYPDLASKRVQSGGVDVSPLEIIAEMPTAFESGTNLNIWQRFIYSRIPNDAARNPAESSQAPPTIYGWRRIFRDFLSVWRKLPHPWKLLETIVPLVKNVGKTKFTIYCAIKLFSFLCAPLEHDPASSLILQKSFLLGAKHGILEIVETILMVYPEVISSEDEEEHSALHLAVMYRHENIFNFIVQQKGGVHKQLLSKVDGGGNNILHLVGQMPYQPQLEVVSGAILQMQRELQWYKEVEKLVSAQAIATKNFQHKTPMMVFDEQHCRMIQSEQQWIVGMASACIVATTIIGTIAFTAVVQVPGGNNGEGRTVLYKEKAFTVFVASNALALYSAISTFLIFLSIYTTRYATFDFLHALPNRLIIGLIALFFSVASTIVAFGSALYLMFFQESQSVILTPVVILSCIPVALFAFFQFPLLQNMIKTTYGRSMFGQKRVQEGINVYFR